MKKVTLLNVLAVIGALALTGCGGGSTPIDNSKAQLTILTYDGGVGDAWLNKAARLFEEENKDREDFEEGKKGIEIHVTKSRTGGTDLLGGDLTHDMYFTENVNYYLMKNADKLADITDILTTPNAEDGGKKIIDKIDENLKNFMNYKGKYYAVPFYDCIYSLVYDKDLFQEKGLYVTAPDGEGLVEFTNEKASFGYGPNNVPGDWDDGLPQTYAQFAQLMEFMRFSDVSPMCLIDGGEMSGYSGRTVMSYIADDEGLEDANLNYTFSGTAHHIIDSFNNGTPVILSEEIDDTNGYRLRRQAGVYNALDFTRNVLCSNPANYEKVDSVTDAQTKLMVGNRVTGAKNVAMIFEGTWWENEAVIAKSIAKGRGRRTFNFGIMPIPKSDASKVGQDATFLNLNESYGFINANTSHMKLAKEFFSFLHTDDQLKAFTRNTGMTRALDYKLDATDYENASSFTKDIIAIKESEHANLLYPYSQKQYFIDDSFDFNSESWYWSVDLKGSNPENPVVAFVSDQSLTARAYFESHVNLMPQSRWINIVGIN